MDEALSMVLSFIQNTLQLMENRKEDGRNLWLYKWKKEISEKVTNLITNLILIFNHPLFLRRDARPNSRAQNDSRAGRRASCLITCCVITSLTVKLIMNTYKKTRGSSANASKPDAFHLYDNFITPGEYLWDILACLVIYLVCSARDDRGISIVSWWEKGKVFSNASGKSIALFAF